MNDRELARFMAKVDMDANGCWLRGGATAKGYSVFVCESKPKLRLAHRVSYEHFVGPLESGKVIHHVCEKTLCVNPEHLEQVTQRENLHRSQTTVNAINAAKSHCDQGHEFSLENTYLSPGGERGCRICRRARRRAGSQDHP